jgi:hypothetical protein
MVGNTDEKHESAVTQLLIMRMASPKQLVGKKSSFQQRHLFVQTHPRDTAAEKRDADHELTKAHLAQLLATEDQARREGGLSWAVHDLMTAEVEKYVRAYSRDEKRAWYEIDKMWVEKLHHTSLSFYTAGEAKWREWHQYMKTTKEYMRKYEERYGDHAEEWKWNAKC